MLYRFLIQGGSGTVYHHSKDLQRAGIRPIVLPKGTRQKLLLSSTERACSRLVMQSQHSYHLVGRALLHLLQTGPVVDASASLSPVLLQVVGFFLSLPCVGYGAYPVLHLMGSEEISMD